MGGWHSERTEANRRVNGRLTEAPEGETWSLNDRVNGRLTEAPEGETWSLNDCTAAGRAAA
jgi:hypothetical protein